MRQIINLTQTTSASYLLLASLDLARRNMAQKGKEMIKKNVEFANYARFEINKIGGYYAYANELANGDSIFDFDLTKLAVYTRNIGLAGKEVYDILRDEYDIQIELGDIGNILAIISAGDRMFEIERLIAALSEIKRLHSKSTAGMFDHEYINPVVKLAPKEAFYAEGKRVLIEQSAGMVSGEFVMCYPPGIPILAPGEEITKDILNYIKYAKQKGCFLTGTEDMDINYIYVV
jgi:lysine decarboxylase